MIRAVLFDLFGTLVRETPKRVFRETLGKMAAVLGVESETFLEAWEATAIDRQTGRLGNMEQNVRAICRRIGAFPDAGAIDSALRIREEMYRHHFVAKEGAAEVLEAVAARGLRTGLISMCAPDTPALWRASSLAARVEVAVFSSETGLRKPDPEIYLSALRALEVGADECVYVGDGAYGELTGAAALGMYPVLILDPDERDGLRPEAERWEGPSISRLRQLPPLLDALVDASARREEVR